MGAKDRPAGVRIRPVGQIVGWRAVVELAEGPEGLLPGSEEVGIDRVGQEKAPDC